jgi:hypothetical protein
MTTLRRKRGDTIGLTVGPVVDSDGVVQNLTGSTLLFTAKARLADLDAAAAISVTGTIRNQTTDKGYGDVVVPAGSTNIVGTFHWDVQVVQPDGFVATLDDGLLVITEDVTRRTS